MWINQNYTKFRKNFDELKRDCVLITNYRAANHRIANLNILKHYEISDDCITFWETGAKKMISQIKYEFGNRNNLLYVVAAGPTAGPIISDLFKNNPNNCYIDFGSAIEPYYNSSGFKRPYMIPWTIYNKRNCCMHDENENFDVSVVLNLFKRPENLEIQLLAIESQTLKPKEILLYQDGTSDTIKIPEQLKSRFNSIDISPINVGVWVRFKFAMNKAKSKYVCIFDDDTIPRSRWLENCHREMLKKEGLYGARGIILKNPYTYPLYSHKYYSVGWDGNLDFSTEVDFAGHSWFLKKEWLPYLFNAPQEIQDYKTAGEDMSLSHQLLKSANIKTYIPPQPIDKPCLHGSIKKYAVNFGKSKNAISSNNDNLFLMNKIIFTLINNFRWNILLHRNPHHVVRIEKCIRKHFYLGHYKYFVKISKCFFKKCLHLIKFYIIF